MTKKMIKIEMVGKINVLQDKSLSCNRNLCMPLHTDFISIHAEVLGMG